MFIILMVVITAGCMSWFETSLNTPEEIVQSNREFTKNDLSLRLITPKASPYIASIKSIYGNDFNNLDRAHHLAMLRLFYEDLKYAESPTRRNLDLFQRLLNLDIERDRAEINRIYDEVFLKFSTEVGISNFREEIRGRVANAINIRHDFHEISSLVPFGVGELAYHCIMMDGSIDIESFHQGLNESPAVDSGKGIHDKFDERMGLRGKLDGDNPANDNSLQTKKSFFGDIDPEFIDESSLVLYFGKTNLRIRYVKDSFTGQYRAAQLLSGPFNPEWLSHRAAMAALTGVRPMDLVFAGTDIHKALMEKANGVVNIVEPEPVLEDVHLQNFIFPYPCDWDKSEDIACAKWDCYSCGVDIYGKLEKVMAQDTLDFTVNMIITDLQDTLFSRTLNRRKALPRGESGPGFHTRYFGGNFHRQSDSKDGSAVYGIGWSFKENKKQRLARINQAVSLPNRHEAIPHYNAYIVNRQIEPLKNNESTTYADIPVFSLPRKLKGTITLWFPVTGMITEDSNGEYQALANLFIVKKGAMKEGRARIRMETMQFSYAGDSLRLADSLQQEIIGSLKEGYIGTYDLRSPGPNGFFTVSCSVEEIPGGEYDAFIFVADYDTELENYRLISTATAENLIVK